jgi:segregation and condensation protein B
MDEYRTNPTPTEPEGPEAHTPPDAPGSGPPPLPGGAAAGEAPPAGAWEIAPAARAPVNERSAGDAPAEAAESPAGPDLARAVSIVESLLLVSSHPLPLDRIGAIAGGLSRAEVREIVRRLKERYPPDAAGIVVEEVAKGLHLRTNPANQDYVRRLFDVRPPRFSRAALETLAIVAYRQPVTRLEIEQIRGVDCAAALKTLMERRLVRVVGKKDVPGKPFLFSTTREFLEIFGLGSLADLPSLRDIEDFLTESRARSAAEAAAEQEILPFDDAGTAGDAWSAGPADDGPSPEAGESGSGDGARDRREADGVATPAAAPALSGWEEAPVAVPEAAEPGREGGPSGDPPREADGAVARIAECGLDPESGGGPPSPANEAGDRLPAEALRSGRHGEGANRDPE